MKDQSQSVGGADPSPLEVVTDPLERAEVVEWRNTQRAERIRQLTAEAEKLLHEIDRKLWDIENPVLHARRVRRDVEPLVSERIAAVRQQIIGAIDEAADRDIPLVPTADAARWGDYLPVLGAAGASIVPFALIPALPALATTTAYLLFPQVSAAILAGGAAAVALSSLAGSSQAGRLPRKLARKYSDAYRDKVRMRLVGTDQKGPPSLLTEALAHIDLIVAQKLGVRP